MNKKYFLILIFTPLALCCSNRATVKAPLATLSQARSYLQQLDPQNFEYGIGEVEIRTNRFGDITALFTPRDTGDARLFILEHSKRAIQGKWPNAEVAYWLHGLLINRLDSQQRYYLAPFTITAEMTYSNLPESWRASFTKSIRGYGLAKMKGLLPGDLSIFKFDGDTYDELEAYRKSIPAKRK